MSTREEVLSYIRKEIHPVAAKEKSGVVKDLSIDGDDVDDFFIKLLKHHPLKLDNQNWTNYFHSEGELTDIIRLVKNATIKIGIGKKQNSRELQPFTVGKLLDLYETQNT